MRRPAGEILALGAVGFVVGAVVLEFFIALALQYSSGAGFFFEAVKFFLTFCSSVLGVFFAVVCVDASTDRLSWRAAIGCVYGVLAAFLGERLAILVVRLAMNIMPLLIVFVGLLLIVAWRVPGTGRIVGAISLLFVVGLLAVGLFGHIANTGEGGTSGSLLYARVLIVYVGGFLLGTALAAVP